MVLEITHAKHELRAALSVLKPTGADGFEGLMAAVLSAATGHAFRLAAAGSQGGRDGAAHGGGSYVTFEAKHYGTTLPREGVLAKVPLLLGSLVPVDLWILAASCEVRSQIGEVLERMRDFGLATLILDWPEHAAIPSLLAALMLAPDVTATFLAENAPGVDCDAVAAALAALGKVPGALQAKEALRAELSGPSLGLSVAQDANRAWLRGRFSDRRAARATFGQTLAPASAMRLAVRARPGVDAQIDGALTRRSSCITIVTGPEGSGKSWAVALRWLAAEAPPLTLFVPAASIATALDEPGAIEALLVARLLEQTGDPRAPGAAQRWHRRLSAWRKAPNGDAPRFVLVVDGLNENPTRGWGTLLDRLADLLHEYGGNLIATSREEFFKTRIKPSLVTNAVVCPLQEWTRPELRALLSELGIDSSQLAPRVLNALRNPRLLGIAMELLDEGEILAAKEISRERLLFEHIRRLGSASEGRPDLFIRSLSDHAASILARPDGALSVVFDTLAGPGTGRPLRAELDAVVGERYFAPLPDDPTRYVLSDDGLSMALGIAMMRSLADVVRAGGDLTEALDRLLEPVAALDSMTEAMSAALLAVSIDEGQQEPVRIALLRGYLQLQNVDERSYPGFAAAIRAMPGAGLEALRQISVGAALPTRLRWLVLALRAARSDPHTVALVVAHARAWLQLYTLKPDRNANRHSPRPDAEKHRAEEAEKLAGRLDALSPSERALLARLERNDTIDTANLAEEAIALVAGLPLAPLADDLVAWAFTSALNPSFRDPDKQFAALIRFNRADFADARAALLRAAEPLAAPDASRTGKWTMVTILRATATLDDAVRESELVDMLIDRSERLESWRLIEDYCATDPCDPEAQPPDNIADTATRYREIPIDKIAAGRWASEHDHFLDAAATGLARFAPDTAVEVHRTYAANVLGRTGEGLRMGVFDLEEHGALLGPLVPDLLSLSRSLCEDADIEELRKSTNWIVQQKTLLGAMLHLDGDAQVAALQSLPPHGPPLVQLDRVFRPASVEALAQLLRDAAASGNKNRLLTALGFAESSGSPFSPQAVAIVEEQLGHEDQSIRALALAALERADDEGATARFAASDWSAGPAREEAPSHLVSAYGSRLLLAAARRGLLSAEDAVARVDATHLGAMAAIFEGNAAPALGARLGGALDAAIGAEALPPAPVIELDLDDDEQEGPHFVSLSEHEKKRSLREFFHNLSESDEEFEEKQKNYRERYTALNGAVSAQGAHLVLDHVSASALLAVLDRSPKTGVRWAERILALDTAELPRVSNFALQLARALSREDPQRAARLFEKVHAVRPIIHIRIGLGELPLEAHCVWQASDSDAMRALRRERLLQADDDAALAAETLAACRAGKWGEVAETVQWLLLSDIPSDSARALMLLGYGDRDDGSEAIFARFDNAQGMLGDALEAARGAYDRNVWAREWHRRMMTAANHEDYWCASVLLRKLVDGRIDLWESEHLPAPDLAECDALLRRRHGKRIAKWVDKRSAKLFGLDAPDPIFLGDERIDE